MPFFALLCLEPATGAQIDTPQPGGSWFSRKIGHLRINATVEASLRRRLFTTIKVLDDVDSACISVFSVSLAPISGEDLNLPRIMDRRWPHLHIVTREVESEVVQKTGYPIMLIYFTREEKRAIEAVVPIQQ